MVRSLIPVYWQSMLTRILMAYSRFRQELPHVSLSYCLTSDGMGSKIMLQLDRSLVLEDLLRPHLDMQTSLAFFYCSRTSGQSERKSAETYFVAS